MAGPWIGHFLLEKCERSGDDLKEGCRRGGQKPEEGGPTRAPLTSAIRSILRPGERFPPKRDKTSATVLRMGNDREVEQPKAHI